MRSLLLLATIAIVTSAHGQPAQKPAGKTVRYASASWRWTISYPAGWSVDSKDSDLIRIHSTADKALCTIHSGALDRFNTVDELTDFLLAHDETFFGGKGQKFVVLSRSRITLPGGIVGNDVRVEIGPGGRSRRIHVLRDGRGLAIDCEAYTKDWSGIERAYQRVIESFTVLK